MSITENVKPLKEFVKNAEREYIISLLPQFKYNYSKLAKALDIDRKTLYNKIGPMEDHLCAPVKPKVDVKGIRAKHAQYFPQKDR